MISRQFDDDDAPDLIVVLGIGQFIEFGTGDTVLGGELDDVLFTGDWIDPADPAVIEDFHGSSLCRSNWIPRCVSVSPVQEDQLS